MSLNSFVMLDAIVIVGTTPMYDTESECPNYLTIALKIDMHHTMTSVFLDIADITRQISINVWDSRIKLPEHSLHLPGNKGRVWG